MPTGYTADVKDGISFEQFVWGCARAMGALLPMRDLPSTAPIPERFEPGDWNANRLTAARDELATLEKLSPMEISELSSEAYKVAEQQRMDSLAGNRRQIKAYRVMLARVRQWDCPSQDHEGLKQFMISQLEESIKFDDSTEFYAQPTPKLSSEDWLESRKAKVLKDIEYHKAEHAKEIERTEQRNAWIAALRASLNPA